MKLILLLIAERFLIYMDQKIKADDEKLSSDDDVQCYNNSIKTRS